MGLILTQTTFLKTLLIALAAGLVLASPSLAHVTVSPGLLESGREATLRIELPVLRAGPPPTALDVSGPGLRMLSSSSAGRLGEESRWRVRVAVETEPGPLPLLLTARYPDGRSVSVRQTVTVLPATAAAPSSRPVLLAGAGVLALLAATAALLLRRRSRAAPPRSG